jgi:gliding motility-associated-like protein
VDDPDCVGDANGQIEVEQITGGTAPFDYTWSNQATGSQIGNLAPGSYTVTVTDANGCRLIETYTLPAPIPIDPDIGQNIRINVGQLVHVQLTVKDSGTVSDVVWDGVAPACPGCFHIEFPADTSGQVLVTVVDTNGCEAMASLTLTVLRPRNVFPPSVFTPNGDEINDVFNIKGNTISLIKSLRVYDRWGGLVYERLNLLPNSNTEGWDGTRNGKLLSPGVYVFTAELLHDDGFEEIIKGDVTLLK